MDDKKIDKAIRFYKDQKNEILVNIDLNNSISDYQVIEYGKNLEAIALKLDALFFAKNN